MTTKFRHEREVDEPLQQDARYRFNPEDRAYIDDQVRALQEWAVEEAIPDIAELKASGGGGGASGKLTKAVTTADVTLTDEEAGKALLETTGTLTARRKVIYPVPATEAESYQRTVRHTGAAYNLAVGTTGAEEIEIEPGAEAIVEITPSGARVITDLVLDPRNFGCPWNGVDDDLPGLQAMIASIPASRNRRTVIQLPKGQGYCSDDWRINRPVDIRGHGKAYLAAVDTHNGIKFPPLRGLVFDGYYSSTEYPGLGRADNSRMRDVAVRSTQAVISDPVVGLGRGVYNLDTSLDIWSELPATVTLGSVVIRSGAAGSGAQTTYFNEGATRGGVLVMYRCTTAGTKGSAEPAAFATSGVADIGTTIAATGGTAVWTIESVPKDYVNGTAYVAGQRVFVPGDPDHVFEALTAGTSISGANNFAAWGIGVRVPSSFTAPGYGEEFYEIGTTIAALSNGVTLDSAPGTINVADTTDFAASGTIYVWTGATFATVAYTGKTATTFTGCSGGSGTMSTGAIVGQGIKWRTLSAAGITVLANWVEIGDCTIAGHTGCAVWVQANAGYEASHGAYAAGGSNFWSVRNCIFGWCGSGLTTNSNNTNGGATQHIQYVYLGSGRTNVDALAYLNIAAGKWGTGASSVKDRTQGTNYHVDHYPQFQTGMPFRNDLLGAAELGNNSRWEKLTPEVSLPSKLLSPAVVSLHTGELSTDSTALVIGGSQTSNLVASVTGGTSGKNLEARLGRRTGSTAPIEIKHEDDAFSSGINNSPELNAWPAGWWAVGSTGSGYFPYQAFAFPRAGSSGYGSPAWYSGASINQPNGIHFPAWIPQERIHIGFFNTDPPSIGFYAAAPTTGYNVAGSIAINNAPASGFPMGWICSVTGTPGTWIPLPNVP